MPVTEEDKQKAEKAYKAYRKDPSIPEAIGGGLLESAKMLQKAPYAGLKAQYDYIAKPIVGHTADYLGRKGEELSKWTGIAPTPIYDPRVAAIVEPAAKAIVAASPETGKMVQTAYPGYYKAGSAPLPNAKTEELYNVSTQPAAPEVPQNMQIQMGGGAPAQPKEISRLGPTVNAAYEKAFASERTAAEQNVQDIRNEYTDAKQFWQTQATDQLAQNDAQASVEAGRLQEQDKKRQAYEQTANQISQLRVDPERFWNNKSTEDKITSQIGLIAGGMLAGMNGGRNIAMDALNAQIDRDIEAQKKNYEIHGDSANAKKSAFTMAMQQTGDVRAAEALTRAGIADAVKYKVESMASRAKGTEAQNNGRTLMAALDMQKAKFLDQSTVFGVPGGGGGLGKKLELQEDIFIPMGKDAQGNIVGSYAADAHEARLVRAKQASAERIASAYDKARQLRDEVRHAEGLLAGNEAYEKLKTLQANSMALVNTDLGQGVLNNHDGPRTLTGMGQWTDNLFVNKSVNDHRIEQSKTEILQSLNREIAIRAGRKVIVRTQVDPNTGNVKSYGIQTGERFDPNMIGHEKSEVSKPKTNAPINPTAKK